MSFHSDQLLVYYHRSPEVLTTCLPLAGIESNQITFALSPVNQEVFYTRADKRVYTMKGLTDASTPCQRLSRWVLLRTRMNNIE